MKTGYVSAIHPEEVAREVERHLALGCTSFVLRPVAGGGMLDQERLGAARYAAGVHADVELEAASVISR
jgi:L-alanine-DL-glutamate epimerase-like enolase superfamily enzyme